MLLTILFVVCLLQTIRGLSGNECSSYVQCEVDESCFTYNVTCFGGPNHGNGCTSSANCPGGQCIPHGKCFSVSGGHLPCAHNQDCRNMTCVIGFGVCTTTGQPCTSPSECVLSCGTLCMCSPGSCYCDPPTTTPPPPTTTPPPENITCVCALTQGYWKNHYPDTWPPALVNSLFCGVLWIDLLNLPTGGDAFLILAHQLIATLINTYNCTPQHVISDAINASLALINDACLVPGPGWITPTDIWIRAMFIIYANLFDEYNNGNLPPVIHCETNSEYEYLVAKLKEYRNSIQ